MRTVTVYRSEGNCSLILSHLGSLKYLHPAQSILYPNSILSSIEIKTYGKGRLLVQCASNDLAQFMYRAGVRSELELPAAIVAVIRLRSSI